MQANSTTRDNGTRQYHLLLALLGALLVALVASLLYTAPAQALNVKRLSAPTRVCPGQNDTGRSARKQEQAMRCLINYARARKGMRQLSRSRKLDASARRKSKDMKRCGSFDHYACGREFTFWMRKVGYGSRCWSAAENIAWGQSHLGSARSIFQAWLRSPGHRANIFSKQYRQFGIGLRKGSFQGNSGSQIWTNHFGKSC